MARNWRMRTATHFRSRETARTRSAEYKLACDAALVEVGMGFHCYRSRDEFPSIKQVFRSVLLEKEGPVHGGMECGEYRKIYRSGNGYVRDITDISLLFQMVI